MGEIDGRRIRPSCQLQHFWTLVAHSATIGNYRVSGGCAAFVPPALVI